MNSIVIYSSRTGNTKQVAEAIVGVLPEGTPCVPVNEAPADLSQYDLVFMGFWADQGNADKAAQAVLKRIDNESSSLCYVRCTADDAPCERNHGSRYRSFAKRSGANRDFHVPSKVDPKVIEMMFKIFPDGHPHGRNPEREERHKQAASHPDANDLANAAAFAKDVLAN